MEHLPGVRRLMRHVGNRGIVLALIGLIWLFLGLGLVTEGGRTTGLIDELLPVKVRGVIWASSGLVALTSSVARRLDDLAWTLLIIPPAIRVGAYLWAYIASFLGIHVGQAPGIPLWLGLGIYAALALMVNRCAAGLDRPPPWSDNSGHTH